MARFVFVCALCLVPLHCAAAQATQAAAPQAQQVPSSTDNRRWQDVYTAAVRSIQQGNWQAGITGMRAALALRPQQGRRVVFQGSLVDAYIPDYYLGVAYSNLRDYAQADQAFDRARQAKLVVAGDAQYAAFQSQSSSAKFEATLVRAQDALKSGDSATATRLADAAAGLGGDAARVSAVRGQIDQLAKANTPAQTPNAAAPQTQVAGNVPAPGPPTNTGLPGIVPNPTQTNPAPQSQTAATPAATARGGKAPGPSPVRPAPYVPPRAATAVTRPIGPAPGAGDERTSIASFYAGRYADAAGGLTALIAAARARQASLTPRAQFYLACSLAALVITGDRPRADLDSAKQALTAAGDVMQFAADLRFVSPRVLASLGVRP